MSSYYSQEGQDKYLYENVFKNYKNGVFVDVGSHDGLTINNTIYFEKEHNWTGINIEPIRSVYDKLVINRPNNINLNCAVTDYNGTAEFILNTGYTEMISGLKSNYDIRHKNRLYNELYSHGGNSDIVIVNTRTLESIFDEHNIKHVNYLSVDVEGAEFNVIKSINFDKVFIDVIGFENNYEDLGRDIIDYLLTKDYKAIHKCIDVFMIHNSSKFNLTS